MVKYVKFIDGDDRTYKISEREYGMLKERGERLKVTKSVTRNRKKRADPFDMSGFFEF